MAVKKGVLYGFQ